ncbi:MAG: CoA pyrophosphatase [Hyphomonadaceae bacterium]
MPMDLKARMAGNLAAFPRRAIAPEGRRQAAVAILVFPQETGAAFALTRRSLTLRHNAGNYALPGGKLDAGEDAIDAAVRETSEELGVFLMRDAALGMLDDFITLGGHVVTPVVLWSDAEVMLKPDPTEVHEAWKIPLAELDLPQSPRFVPQPISGPPILQMYLRDDWVNAPTAAWIYQFREVALHGRATRIDEVGQPAWTAR